MSRSSGTAINEAMHLDGSTDVLHLLKQEFGKLSYVPTPIFPGFAAARWDS